MVCLFHGDYGPADPAFHVGGGSASDGRGGVIDAVLLYIWFRFEWQFGVGVVATLILDVTKKSGSSPSHRSSSTSIPWRRC